MHKMYWRRYIIRDFQLNESFLVRSSFISAFSYIINNKKSCWKNRYTKTSYFQAHRWRSFQVTSKDARKVRMGNASISRRLNREPGCCFPSHKTVFFHFRESSYIILKHFFKKLFFQNRKNRICHAWVAIKFDWSPT